MNDATTLAAATGPQRILGAHFEPIQHREAAMVIAVFAMNLHIGGAQLFARLGNQSIISLRSIGDGRGFTGLLRQAPHDGDRLYLQYLGRLEHKTDIVYHGGSGRNPNVA